MRLSPREMEIGRTIFRVLARRLQLLHAGFLNEIDERRGAAVHDRHFRRVQLDQHVIDVHADERRQEMLDGLDRDLVSGQAGGELDAGEVMHRRGHFEVAEVGPAEPDSETGGRGLERELNLVA